jgi:hypothetical protein
MTTTRPVGWLFASLASCTLALAGCQTMPSPGAILCEVIKSPFLIVGALDQQLGRNRAGVQQPQQGPPQWQTVGGDLRSVRTSETVPMPPAPQPVQRPAADDPGSEAILTSMWHSYEAFDYQRVIVQANALLNRPESSPGQRAKAYIMAASSLYVLNDASQAFTCLQSAVNENPSVQPNPNMLPGEICRIHKSILVQRQ